MATSNCTLGYRFAESKILAKTRFHSTAPLSTESCPPGFSPLFDTHIAELMETLRKHMNAVLRLPMFIVKRPFRNEVAWLGNSALHKSGEVEYLVKEIRLLLDPAGLESNGIEPERPAPTTPQQHQTAKSP